MKTLLLILFITQNAFSSIHILSSKRQAPTNSVYSNLQNKKKEIDAYLKKHTKDITVMAKVVGKKDLVKVMNEKWPDNVEYSYNILRGPSGKVLYIMQSPFSESGDWDINYIHYFNESGNTIAFYRIESIFEGSDEGSVVRETLLKYYDERFKIVKQFNGITDANDHPVKKNKDGYDFRNFKYTIYKNVNDCLAGYNILIK